MIADILAMQTLYGLSTTTRTGDTTCGYNSNTGNAALDQAVTLNDPHNNNYVAFTIFDNGGADTVDLSGYAGSQAINLTPGASSNVLGGRLNMGIAYGTVVENAYGGSGDDGITGNDADNLLRGGAGDDNIYGGSGNDTLDAGTGRDILGGGEGNDLLRRFTVVNIGGAGNIDGGRGLDTVDFSGVTANPIDVNLDAETYAALEYLVGYSPSPIWNVENVLGSVQNDEITGGDGANKLYGMAGDDTISGGYGDDTLEGGAGSDTLVGGGGNDTFYFGEGDTLIEHSRDGTDRVYSDFSYALGLNFENLKLSGAAAINGFGNSLANQIVGNSGNNVLNGTTGTDRLAGGTGNDTYVTDGGDTITEAASAGTDLVQSSVSLTLGSNLENLTLTGAAAINGTGNVLANILTGNAGNNLLTGGLGNDTLIGGAGNDIYVVDSTGDRVFETMTTASLIDAGGTDTVQSAVGFNLDASAGVRFVERLMLSGTGNINGIGNALGNILTGNIGHNVLMGGLGNDTMVGGAGNDTYVVDATGDRVFETTTIASIIDAGGTDTVQSAVGFNLDATAGVRFVERLSLTGTGNINGIGNALANILTGNTSNNALNSGLGNDTMVGGAGNDIFVFNTALSAANVDRITDFNVVDDTIRLDDAVFAGLTTGTLGASAFVANLTGVASDALERIIYETNTGRIYFDADGSGSGARLHFATLTANLALTNADFFVL